MIRGFFIRYRETILMRLFVPVPEPDRATIDLDDLMKALSNAKFNQRMKERLDGQPKVG